MSRVFTRTYYNRSERQEGYDPDTFCMSMINGIRNASTYQEQVHFLEDALVAYGARSTDGLLITPDNTLVTKVRLASGTIALQSRVQSFESHGSQQTCITYNSGLTRYHLTINDRRDTAHKDYITMRFVQVPITSQSKTKTEVCNFPTQKLSTLQQTFGCLVANLLEAALKSTA